MPRKLKQTPALPLPEAKKKVVNRANTRNLLLFLLGGLLLYASYYLRLHKSQITSALSTDFSTEPVKIDKAITTLPHTATPTRILIPSLSLDISVVPSEIKNGYWVVPPDSAGFGLGSAPPGTGNTVIFAHARKGLFLPLSDITVGQHIYVIALDKVYTYKVDNIKSVYPHQLEVIYPTPLPVLTLYTCSGFLDRKRLVVTAKLL